MLVSASRRLPVFMICAPLCYASVAAAASPSTVVTPRALKVFPAEVNLLGPRDSQRIGVLGEYADGRLRDLARKATYTSSAPAVRRPKLLALLHCRCWSRDHNERNLRHLQSRWSPG